MKRQNMIELLNLNYNEYVQLIGTAHFTRRSINDAYEAVKSLKPIDVALELDLRRYINLNAACTGCPRNVSCKGLCEFTGATDALGNVDANIWLIDMNTLEMRQRIRGGATPYEKPRIGEAVRLNPDKDPIQLWEMGYKKEVVDYSEKQMDALRSIHPTIPRVLIDERNALMAARLAWITSKNLSEEKKPKILAFIGAAHVKGIEAQLGNPLLIKEGFRRFNLSFSEPTLIRRVAIREASN